MGGVCPNCRLPALRIIRCPTIATHAETTSTAVIDHMPQPSHMDRLSSPAAESTDGGAKDLGSGMAS